MMIVIREDGGIDLIDEETEEVFYYFAPPCMYDAAGNYSEQVHYELETDAEQHCSILSVVPDQKWLQDENRVYPVVIDPSAETSKTNRAIDDTFVREKSPDSAVVASYGSFTVGHNREYGKCRSFLKFTSLPAMEPGAVIYDAKIYVWQYRYSSDSNQPFFITAHKVTGGWNPGSTTWNNQPAYQSNVLDYCSVKQVQSGNTITVTPCGFNVTKLVREWYNTGVNHGIVITAQNETPYQEAVFISSDYPSNNSYGITSEYFPQGIGDIPSVAVFVALAALRFLCPPDRSHRRSAAELWRSAPPRPRPSPIRRDTSRLRLSADGRAPRRRSPFPVRRVPPRRNPGRCRLSATATSCPT